MSELLTSWRDSLAIFKPSSFKLFALVTLKATYDSFYAFIRTGGIAVCLLPGFIYALLNFITDHYELDPTTRVAVRGILIAFVTVVVEWTQLIIVRPSTERKDAHYLFEYLGRYALVMLCWIPLVVGKLLLQSFATAELISAIFDPWLGVLGLFILDSPVSLRNIAKSVHRSILMLVYNAPFWIIFVAFAGVVIVLNNMVGQLVDRFLIHIHHAYGQLVVLPLMAAWMIWVVCIMYLLLFCTMANFYTKRIHEQPGLYFRK